MQVVSTKTLINLLILNIVRVKRCELLRVSWAEFDIAFFWGLGHSCEFLSLLLCWGNSSLPLWFSSQWTCPKSIAAIIHTLLVVVNYLNVLSTWLLLRKSAARCSNTKHFGAVVSRFRYLFPFCELSSHLLALYLAKTGRRTATPVNVNSNLSLCPTPYFAALLRAHGWEDLIVFEGRKAGDSTSGDL